MNQNPYQPPSEQGEVKSSPDPLRLPAIGCAVGAAVAFLWAMWMIYYFTRMLTYVDEEASPELVRIAWEGIQSSSILFVLSPLALAAVWSMHARRNRWFILLSSVLGLLLCFPAPLAAIILLRLRQKDVWESFGQDSTEPMATAPRDTA